MDWEYHYYNIYCSVNRLHLDSSFLSPCNPLYDSPLCLIFHLIKHAVINMASMYRIIATNRLTQCFLFWVSYFIFMSALYGISLLNGIASLIVNYCSSLISSGPFFCIINGFFKKFVPLETSLLSRRVTETFTQIEINITVISLWWRQPFRQI